MIMLAEHLGTRPFSGGLMICLNGSALIERR